MDFADLCAEPFPQEAALSGAHCTMHSTHRYVCQARLPSSNGSLGDHPPRRLVYPVVTITLTAAADLIIPATALRPLI